MDTGAAEKSKELNKERIRRAQFHSCGARARSRTCPPVRCNASRIFLPAGMRSAATRSCSLKLTGATSTWGASSPRVRRQSDRPWDFECTVNAERADKPRDGSDSLSLQNQGRRRDRAASGPVSRCSARRGARKFVASSNSPSRLAPARHSGRHNRRGTGADANHASGGGGPSVQPRLRAGERAESSKMLGNDIADGQGSAEQPS